MGMEAKDGGGGLCRETGRVCLELLVWQACSINITCMSCTPLFSANNEDKHLCLNAE